MWQTGPGASGGAQARPLSPCVRASTQNPRFRFPSVYSQALPLTLRESPERWRVFRSESVRPHFVATARAQDRRQHHLPRGQSMSRVCRPREVL